MTVLIGLHVPGRIWLAADMQTTFGNGHILAGSTIKIVTLYADRASPKHDAALACAGDNVACAIARHEFRKLAEADDPQFIGWEVAKAVRERCKGLSEDKLDFEALMVHGGHLYDVDTVGSANEIERNVLWGRGIGGNYAIGAGHAARRLPPEERIRIAYDAACTFSRACGGQMQLEALSSAILP